MDKRILETKRLYLREITENDFGALCGILQDIEVMYAWERAFSEEEVTGWIQENRKRYGHEGYSYWAVVEKEEERLIGVCGILAEQVEGERRLGVGYIFNKNYWNQGFAFESASACVDYAFEVLGAEEITAQIRPNNSASRRIAERLGMEVEREFIRQYRGKDMPHLLYRRKRPESSLK